MEETNNVADDAIKNMAPKKSKKGLVGVIATILVVALAAAGGWYFFGESEDTPPTLEIGGSKFQGRSVTDFGGYMKYNADDEAAYVAPADAIFATSGNAVQYFSSLTDKSINEVLDAVKPVDGLRVLVAVYTDGCYHLYPQGPFDPAKSCLIPDADLDKPLIKANQGFALMADKSFEYNGKEIRSAKTLSGEFSVGLEADTADWILKPAAPETNLTNAQILNAYKQTEDNKFVKVTDRAAYDPAAEAYKMIWIKADTSINATDPVPAPPPVCGNSVVESGEVCDDGNTVAGDLCSADCKSKGILKSIPPICGDGNVDEGEECDDGDNNSNTAADACRNTCKDPVCGDGVVDTGEACDDGNDGEQDGCLNDCKLGSKVIPVIPEGIIIPDRKLVVPDAKFVEPLIVTDRFKLPSDLLTRPVAIAPTEFKLEYIDNLQDQFVKDTSNFPGYRKGDLYGDIVDDTPRAIMAALKVSVPEVMGPIRLNTIMFSNNGYTLDKQPINDYKNRPINPLTAKLNYCNGHTEWFINLYWESNGVLYNRILFSKDDINSFTTYTFNQTNKQDAASIAGGTEAIITLEMTGLDKCVLSEQLVKVSTSEANFTFLSFTNASGVVLNYTDQTSITDYNTHDHWINWLEPVTTFLLNTDATLKVVPITTIPLESKLTLPTTVKLTR